MNYFLVLSFGQVTPDRQTDRRTESDAYEPTVHKHRCAQKCNSGHCPTRQGRALSWLLWSVFDLWHDMKSPEPTISAYSLAKETSILPLNYNVNRLNVGLWSRFEKLSCGTASNQLHIREQLLTDEWVRRKDSSEHPDWTLSCNFHKMKNLFSLLWSGECWGQHSKGYGSVGLWSRFEKLSSGTASNQLHIREQLLTDERVRRKDSSEHLEGPACE